MQRKGPRGEQRANTQAHTRAAPPPSQPNPACPAPSQEPQSPRPPPRHHHNRPPRGAAEDDTRHTAAKHTVDTDTSPTPTTRRTHRCGAPTHNAAPMDAVHPKNPLQPAGQRPPRGAPRGRRGIPTHSAAPTLATRRHPTTGPPHTRAHSPPPTVETIHPNHTPPHTTRGHRTGATTRPSSRDPPTRGPRKRNTPHQRTHPTAGRHPQAPHDHTPLVATLQSRTPRPRGPQALRHTDPAQATY